MLKGVLGLFFAHKHIYRSAGKVPMFAYFVFEISAIWLFNPLRQIAEENECGHLSTFKHGNIFNLHEFAFIAWRWICSDIFLHHGVELRCGYCAFAVCVYFGCSFKNFEYSLFCQCRCKYDGEICKRGETFAYGSFVVLDSSSRFVGNQIPFVHHYHETLFVTLD